MEEASERNPCCFFIFNTIGIFIALFVIWSVACVCGACIELTKEVAVLSWLIN
jgi:TM2 domain-containing membrane protein YozV